MTVSAPKPPKPAAERFVVTLSAMPSHLSAITRLRAALKQLCRAYGLRCVGCEELTTDKRQGPPGSSGSKCQ